MVVSGDLVIGKIKRACAPYLHVSIGGFRGNRDASSRLASLGRQASAVAACALQTAEQIRFPARNESRS
jgi:hypothetical protein